MAWPLVSGVGRSRGTNEAGHMLDNLEQEQMQRREGSSAAEYLAADRAYREAARFGVAYHKAGMAHLEERQLEPKPKLEWFVQTGETPMSATNH